MLPRRRLLRIRFDGILIVAHLEVGHVHILLAQAERAVATRCMVQPRGRALSETIAGVLVAPLRELVRGHLLLHGAVVVRQAERACPSRCVVQTRSGAIRDPIARVLVAALRKLVRGDLLLITHAVGQTERAGTAGGLVQPRARPVGDAVSCVLVGPRSEAVRGDRWDLDLALLCAQHESARAPRRVVHAGRRLQKGATRHCTGHRCGRCLHAHGRILAEIDSGRPTRKRAGHQIIAVQCVTPREGDRVGPAGCHTNSLLESGGGLCAAGTEDAAVRSPLLAVAAQDNGGGARNRCARQELTRRCGARGGAAEVDGVLASGRWPCKKLCCTRAAALACGEVDGSNTARRNVHSRSNCCGSLSDADAVDAAVCGPVGRVATQEDGASAGDGRPCQKLLCRRGATIILAKIDRVGGHGGKARQ
mmetsp:Transcript_101784/g.217959  ORF Transcript_101784/g.217959 Transcript_101784/m.217959 type:complete len:421 (+) Transcript_101784:109-1371(+)